jgi:tripartite-type tricarboxylate transporter receptor subunit TctC
MAEFVPGCEASGLTGIVAPKNYFAEIIETLNAEINACLADPKMKGRFAGLGASVLVATAADFGRFIVEETEKWGKLIRLANVSLD